MLPQVLDGPEHRQPVRPVRAGRQAVRQGLRGRRRRGRDRAEARGRRPSAPPGPASGLPVRRARPRRGCPARAGSPVSSRVRPWSATERPKPSSAVIPTTDSSTVTKAAATSTGWARARRSTSPVGVRAGGRSAAWCGPPRDRELERQRPPTRADAGRCDRPRQATCRPLSRASTRWHRQDGPGHVDPLTAGLAAGTRRARAAPVQGPAVGARRAIGHPGTDVLTGAPDPPSHRDHGRSATDA